MNMAEFGGHNFFRRLEGNVWLEGGFFYVDTSWSKSEVARLAG